MADEDDAARVAAQAYIQAKYAATYGSSLSYPGSGVGGGGGSGVGGGSSGGAGSVSTAGGCGPPFCTCSACLGLLPPPVPAPQPTPGIGGFGEEGPEDFAAGTLTGYRWWTLPAPDFRRDPLTADEYWPRALLHGQRAGWKPGVQEAVCLAGPGAHEEKVPARSCGCGIWFYKTLAQHNMSGGSGELAIPGVVEGWGRSRTGSLGFRTAKARILALCLQFEIQAYRSQPGWYDAFGQPPGQVDIPQAEKDRLECWMAVIEDRLAQTYPGVRMYSVQKAMLARFPLRS